MKKLPKRISEEKFFKLNYANARFMNSKEAYRTNYHEPGAFLTLKCVEGDDFNLNKKVNLVQLHLRTKAKDRINNKDEDLDIDIYFYEDEFNKKVIEMLSSIEYAKEVKSKMDVTEYTKQQGSFLKADDVKNNPDARWEITEEGIFKTSERFGNQRLHLPVKNGDKAFIFDCSKTNARFITEQIGSDTKNWIGKLLTLETYKTKTSDGKLVNAINVKEVK